MSSSSSSSESSSSSSSPSSSSSSVYDAKIAADRYRFSGLPLVTIRLDDGFEYMVSLDYISGGSPLWWNEMGVSYGTSAGFNIDDTDYPSGGSVPIL